MKKSSKRSAARTRQRPRSPLTLYVDECRGRGIALRLQSEGHDARPFDEFAGKSDVQLLPLIGERQWVFLTKDKNVRTNHLEVDAILNAGGSRIRDHRDRAEPPVDFRSAFEVDAQDWSDWPKEGTLRLQHHGDGDDVADLSPDARETRDSQEFGPKNSLRRPFRNARMTDGRTDS